MKSISGNIIWKEEEEEKEKENEKEEEEKEKKKIGWVTLAL